MAAAVVLRQFGLGNLRLEAFQRAEPVGPGQVRVAIRTVSLNYRDLLVIRGTYCPGLQLPLIPLSDAAGFVTEVGDGVDGLQPGDRVVTHTVPDWGEGPLLPAMRLTTLGGPAQGVLCSEQVLPAQAVLRLPDSITFEAAACLPTAGLASWSAFRRECRVGPGTTLLLQGTGGVAMMGLAIGKALGARVAITSSSAAKLLRATELGADLVVDRHDPEWSAQVREWSDGGVDVMLDIGGAPTLDAEIRAVREGGTILALGVLAHHSRLVDFAEIVIRRIRVQGIFLGSRIQFADLIDFVATHKIEPVIDVIYNGLDAARHAIADFASGGHVGKVVIRHG